MNIPARKEVQESYQQRTLLNWAANKRRIILPKGAKIPRPLVVVSGWAGLIRGFASGKRTILAFSLPGDLAGHMALRSGNYEYQALSDVKAVAAEGDIPTISRMTEDEHMLAQISRLHQSTLQSIASFFIEAHDRYTKAGITSDNTFPLPVTQEVLGDGLSISCVHTNRTLKHLRDSRIIQMEQGFVKILDSSKLAKIAEERLA